MFLQVNTNDGNFLINTKYVAKLATGFGGTTTVVTLSTGEVFSVNEPFDSFKVQFLPSEPKTVMEHLGIPGSQTNTTDLYKDLDQYPAHLPRLPTGYVDKRTTAYKEYTAANITE
jgi:hypothetical protein